MKLLHHVIEHLKRLKYKLFDPLSPDYLKALLKDLDQVSGCRCIQVAVPVIFFDLSHFFLLPEDVHDHGHDLAVRLFGIGRAQLQIAVLHGVVMDTEFLELTVVFVGPVDKCKGFKRLQKFK